MGQEQNPPQKGEMAVTTDGLPVQFDGQNWVPYQKPSGPFAQGWNPSTELRSGYDSAVDTLKNPLNWETIGGILGAGTMAFGGPKVGLPASGPMSVINPILAAMAGGATGNALGQYAQDKKVDPSEAGMGAVRQGAWETFGQVPRLPQLFGWDKRMYRGTGRFNGPGMTPEKVNDAIDFAFRNNIITPQGAEQAGQAASQRTTDAVRAASNWRPPVSGYLPAGTEELIAGNAPPSVGGGRPAVQEAEIAGRARDIVGAGGVPSVNPQFSGEMRDNMARGVEQPQPTGDQMTGAGTIRIPRDAHASYPYDPNLAHPNQVAPQRIVVLGLNDAVRELDKRSHNQTALGRLQQMVDDFLHQKGDHPLSYQEVDDLRKAEQKQGKSFYDASGRIANPSNDIDAMYHAGIGSGASQVLKDDIPSTRQSLKDAADSINLQRGIQPISEQSKGSIPFLNAMGGPTRGLLGPAIYGAAHYGGGMSPLSAGALALGTWAATSPEALRGMAIGYNKTAPYLPALMRVAHGATSLDTRNPNDIALALALQNQQQNAK